MKTIVVSNRKGGSGKSTTAVNLATELSKTRSVLLIDFDTQGHASMGVGCDPVEEGGAHGIFTGGRLSESFMPTVLDNLTLSPAQEMFDVYEYADLRGVLKNRFKKERIGEFFDYCVIDTPPTYDALLKNSLEVADAVIIPVIPHYLGVVGVGQMFRAIYRMAAEGGNTISLVGALPVMYNPHINEHKEAMAHIAGAFGKDKLFDPIGVDINLSRMFREKSPAVLLEKRSKGANDYKAFAKTLLERLEP